MTHKTITTDNYILIVDENEKPIAHLPLNQAPILEGVDLLPPLEDDVERLAKNFANDSAITNYEEGINVGKYQGFISGYNKAKEKYKYTKEDIKSAIHFGVTHSETIKRGCKDLSEFIQSLSKPKMPIMFKRELAIIMGKGEPIIERNPQGHKLWVGKWIY